MKHIDMEKFAGGAFTTQINRELEKVTENIQDPNTDATAKRRITVVIEFKPNEARNFVTTGVQAKSTLAPALGAVTALSMGKNLKTNEVEAEGGLWKHEAMQNVKDFLANALADETELMKNITIIA